MKRTSYTKNQRIARLGKTDENNLYIDRYTGEKLSLKNVQLGHKQYCEDRFFREVGDRLGMTQREFNKCMRNMGDKIFQPQSAKSNLSHLHECKDYDIGMNNTLHMLKTEWKALAPEKAAEIDKQALRVRCEIMKESHKQYMENKAKMEQTRLVDNSKFKDIRPISSMKNNTDRSKENANKGHEIAKAIEASRSVKTGENNRINSMSNSSIGSHGDSGVEAHVSRNNGEGQSGRSSIGRSSVSSHSSHSSIGGRSSRGGSSHSTGSSVSSHSGHSSIGGRSSCGGSSHSSGSSVSSHSSHSSIGGRSSCGGSSHSSGSSGGSHGSHCSSGGHGGK